MNKVKIRRVNCPTCKKSVLWIPESRWRPFCSERCKLIDLGDWFEERNRIADETTAILPNEGEDDSHGQEGR